jgi:predicted dehydrogenase
VKGGTANGTGLLFEIHGSEGDIVIAPRAPRAGSSVQISELTLRGSQGSKPLADLPIPESCRWVPPAVPAGPPFNVAQLFKRMADGIRDGRAVSPGFDLALTRHRLLDAIQRASDSGIRQVL